MCPYFLYLLNRVMSRGLPTRLRMRELTGRLDYTALQDQCIELVTEYFEHEYMFDHQDLYVLFNMLLERIRKSTSALAIMLDYIYSNETSDDNSIVWLALYYSKKSNDVEVDAVCNNIKENSL